MTRKTIINKSLANDCCHYVGFCKDGVIKDKSVYGFTHSITIELDPVPGYRYGVCAPLTVYIPHGHKEMWKGRNLSGCTISILAYTKPVNTPSGRKYPLPVAVSIDAIYVPKDISVSACANMSQEDDDDEEEDEG
jgi:hypothetical protein